MITSMRRRTGTAHSADSCDTQPSIQIRQVGKAFDNGTEAISDTTLDVAAGEFVTIVGASGCGKSTLLRIVAGLMPATRGAVTVSGTAVTGPRKDVGLMFQKPALLEWKCALENVVLPVAVRGRVQDEHLEEAMRLLTLFGLAGAEFRFPRQLSGGMQQRVALARLLMTHARVRLLDEPFAAVDELAREHLNVELLRIHDRDASATLLVTHNIFEAVLLSDRVVVMGPRPGRIIGDVPITLARPRAPEMIRLPEFQQLAADVRALLVDGTDGGRR